MWPRPASPTSSASRAAAGRSSRRRPRADWTRPPLLRRIEFHRVIDDFMPRRVTRSGAASAAGLRLRNEIAGESHTPARCPTPTRAPTRTAVSSSSWRRRAQSSSTRLRDLRTLRRGRRRAGAHRGRDQRSAERHAARGPAHGLGQHHALRALTGRAPALARRLTRPSAAEFCLRSRSRAVALRAGAGHAALARSSPSAAECMLGVSIRLGGALRQLRRAHRLRADRRRRRVHRRRGRRTERRQHGSLQPDPDASSTSAGAGGAGDGGGAGGCADCTRATSTAATVWTTTTMAGGLRRPSCGSLGYACVPAVGDG